MSDFEKTTQQAILTAGKIEFLAKGFACASLRNIVKEAGVTTGAFYGYYKSKEALFDALVEKDYRMLMDTYLNVQTSFANLPIEEQQEGMNKVANQCMNWMVDYIYEHFETFKLLLCHAQGTRYETMIHEMVEIEEVATHHFIAVLQQLGHHVKSIDTQLEHILVSGLFSSFFEMVVHDMPYEQAVDYVRVLQDFYTAGWTKIMGL